MGILSTNTDNFELNTGTNTHPLNTINNSWGDIRFGATLGSFLNGYSDARAPKYALPATDPAVLGQFIGVRTGINIDAKGRYENYSQMVTFPNFIQLMTSAEAWFLKSEAAMRGWAGAGDAKTNYNNGILASFSQYGLDGTSYMNDATSVPQQYIDPNSVTAGENDVKTGNPNLSTITIKWDPAATQAQQLERIITQKYIAMYPDGQEAWSEFRRTGYPKLWPNTVNYSNGLIPTQKMIRRIPFAQSEVNTNPGVLPEQSRRCLAVPTTPVELPHFGGMLDKRCLSELKLTTKGRAFMPALFLYLASHIGVYEFVPLLFDFSPAFECLSPEAGYAFTRLDGDETGIHFP